MQDAAPKAPERTELSGAWNVLRCGLQAAFNDAPPMRRRMPLKLSFSLLCKTIVIDPGLSRPLFPLGHKFLVMSLLATGLRVLDLRILALEAPSLFLSSHGFLHKVVGTVSFVESRTEEVGGPFDDSASLRESRDFAFAVVLFVMPVRIQD